MWVTPVNAKQCDKLSAEALQGTELVKVKQVVDGDTLRLGDGRKVRLIGVNTPETGKKGRQAEPFSKRATIRLKELIGSSGVVRLKVGEDAKDRYGRLLAYVFTDQGLSIAVALVKEGLGFAVAIPPNLSYLDCVHSAQQEAVFAKRGVWADSYFAPRDSRQLKRADAGFRIVSGRLDKVIIKENKAWWLLFEGRLAVMVPKKGQQYFNSQRLQSLVGQKLVVSGWLIKKKLSAKQKAKKYKPFMMSVKHPVSFVDPVL